MYNIIYITNPVVTQFFFSVSNKILIFFHPKFSIFRIFLKTFIIGIVWELLRFLAIVPRRKSGFLQKTFCFFHLEPDLYLQGWNIGDKINEIFKINNLGKIDFEYLTS
jgi:hypothetical protein